MEKEQDIRIDARGWCGNEGCSENQAENIAIHFYEKGFNDGAKFNEYEELIKIPVKERTNEQHLLLVKYFGGVREYLLSMGEFKEDKTEP